jgi:hypothetical protein
MANVGMGITVVFANGEVGDVQRYMIDRLIREKRIVAFLRISGWVDVGGDTIRKASNSYTTLGNRWSEEFLSERRES